MLLIDKLWILSLFMVQRFFRFLILGIAVFLLAGNALAAITIQFDYTYDTEDFFAPGSDSRATLEWVGEYYGSLLDDDFLAINSYGVNHFDIRFWQPNATVRTTIKDYNVPAHTMVVFVGSQDISGSALAQGGPGGWEIVGSTTWATNAIARGEGAVEDIQGTSATEIAPWGGSITVDSTMNWNLDHKALAVWDEYDFASVLLHEMAHVLGLGISAEESSSNSWENATDGSGLFLGPAAMAANGGSPVPLESDLAHWEDGATNSTIFGTGITQQAIMEPYMMSGAELWTSLLDISALDDIGWDINPIDSWTAASGGTFSWASNWSTGTSPGGRDSVRFGTAGSYSVSFTQNAAVQQISVEAGQVGFALGGNTLEANLLWVTGSGTSLNVEGGTLRVDVYAKLGSGGSVVVGSGGALDLVGATFDGDLTVGSGGTLLGEGVITGDVSHQAGGTVSPGGSGQVGSLAVEDDYLQAEDAVLDIDLLSLVDFDWLEVDGVVSLAGDLVVHVDAGLTLSESDTFDIISCGNLSGQFDSISGDLTFDGLILELVYDEVAVEA